MTESVALLVGLAVGVVAGWIACVMAARGRSRAEQQLRGLAEQGLREQVVSVQREAERSGDWEALISTGPLNVLVDVASQRQRLFVRHL